MNEKIRQKLCELVAQYGFSLCDDQKRCETLLENYFGQSNKEVFILITALRNRIAEDLINTSPSTLKYALYSAPFQVVEFFNSLLIYKILKILIKFFRYYR